MHGIWTTEGVADAQQFAYWRDAVCDAFVPLEPEGTHPRFTGRIESLAGQALHVSSVEADAHPVNLTSHGIRRQGSTNFFANLLLDGDVWVEQFGVREKVNPGDIYLLDTGSPFSVRFATQFRILCVTLDESVLRPRLGRRGRPATPVIRGDRGAGRLTAQYMRSVIGEDAAAVIDVQDIAAPHLAALLARASRGGDPTAARTSSEHSLERIHAFVEAHLADEALSVQAVCDGLNMSRSHLYAVLGEAGQSFASYVRDRRLSECRRSIETMPEKTIAEIAAAWGFSDQSSFARMFKSRFGITPRHARRGS